MVPHSSTNSTKPLPVLEITYHFYTNYNFIKHRVSVRETVLIVWITGVAKRNRRRRRRRHRRPFTSHRRQKASSGSPPPAIRRTPAR